KHEQAAKEIGDLLPQLHQLEPDVGAAVLYELALALRAMGREGEAADAYRALLDNSAAPAPASIAAYSALDLAQLEIKADKHADPLSLLDGCRVSGAHLKGDDASRVQERELYPRAVCQLKLGNPAEAAATLAPFRERFPKSDLAPSAALVLGDALL